MPAGGLDDCAANSSSEAVCGLNRQRAAQTPRHTLSVDAGGVFKQRLHQFVDEVDPGPHVVADAIPFDDRELGIVELAALAGAKRMRHLKDRLGPRGQQPLHVQFGRRLQKLAVFEPQRLDVQLGNHLVGHQRRFDFEKAALVEELAQPPQQIGTLFERGEAWRKAS